MLQQISKENNLLKRKAGLGEMAQWVRVLAYKRWGLNLDLSSHIKYQDMAEHTCDHDNVGAHEDPWGFLAISIVPGSVRGPVSKDQDRK